MPPLALTAENRDAIRALVRQIMPKFEEALWEKARIQSEHELAELKRQEEQKAQWAQAQQQSVTIQPPGQVIFTTTGTTTPTFYGGGGAGGAASVNVYGGGGGGGLYSGSANITHPIYQAVGTGFTTYGPVDPLQGLTLAKS